MQPQEIYDTVVRHLAKQGKPAINNAGECMYRAPDGCKCAAGVLIPDDLYDPDMEYRPIYELVNAPRFHLPSYIGKNVVIIQSLQGAHDDWDANDNDWLATDLREVAAEHSLSSAVVDEVFA